MAGRKKRGGKGARFSYTAGEHGTKVRVYERVRGGVIQIACRDPSLKSGWRRESLEHRNRDEAKRHAEDVAGTPGPGPEDSRRVMFLLADQPSSVGLAACDGSQDARNVPVLWRTLEVRPLHNEERQVLEFLAAWTHRPHPQTVLWPKWRQHQSPVSFNKPSKPNQTSSRASTTRLKKSYARRSPARNSSLEWFILMSLRRYTSSPRSCSHEEPISRLNPFCSGRFR